jgi:hypothetical protein
MIKKLTSIIFLVSTSAFAQIDSTNYLTYLETQIRAIGWPLPVPENPNNYTNDIYVGRTNYPPQDYSNTNLLNAFYSKYSSAPSLTTTRLSYECYNWLTNAAKFRTDTVKIAWDKYLGRGTTNLNSSNTIYLPLTLLSNKLTPVTWYVLSKESASLAGVVPSLDFQIVTNLLLLRTPPKRVLEIHKFQRQ